LDQLPSFRTGGIEAQVRAPSILRCSAFTVAWESSVTERYIRRVQVKSNISFFHHHTSSSSQHNNIIPTTLHFTLHPSLQL
jgi:hypothetical protein